MNDIFQWTPELWCEFLNQRPLIGALETEMEQFKSSKAPKKEWEILAFDRHGVILKLNPHDRRFHSDAHIASLDWALTPGSNCIIHSVRRLSDGEVFSVEEKVKTGASNHYTIQRFSIDRDIMAVYFVESGSNDIVFISKLPQPILTTVDQKEVKEGDLVFYVNSDNFISDIWVTKDSFGDDKNPSNVFSTREAAEAYILNNRPLLSLNDVKGVLGSDYRVHSEVLLSELTALVKQKLNQ